MNCGGVGVAAAVDDNVVVVDIVVDREIASFVVLVAVDTVRLELAVHSYCAVVGDEDRLAEWHPKKYLELLVLSQPTRRRLEQTVGRLLPVKSHRW